MRYGFWLALALLQHGPGRNSPNSGGGQGAESFDRDATSSGSSNFGRWPGLIVAHRRTSTLNVATSQLETSSAQLPIPGLTHSLEAIKPG
jgi:hypothetical protein